MIPARKRRLYFVIATLVMMAIATSLVIYALGQNINLYFTPSQVTQGAAPINHSFRMGGMVKQGSIVRNLSTLQVSFTLTDFQHDVVIHYTGILPSLFRDGQGVVVEGKLAADHQFTATQVLAKHDEKYMPADIKKMLDEKQKQGKPA
jgi:cytochrome c-type biogenesis protein CcmE